MLAYRLGLFGGVLEYCSEVNYSELRGTRKPRFGARLDFLSRLAAAASLYFLSSFS